MQYSVIVARLFPLIHLPRSVTCGIIPTQLNSPNRHSYPERRRDRPDDASTTGRRKPNTVPNPAVGATCVVAHILEDERAAVRLAQLPFLQKGQFHF
jgi:hypothetical protein